MKLLDILTSPWAIVPEKLLEIQEIYFIHLRGERIDIKGIKTRIGKPLKREEQNYETRNGVAIIPIDGPIAKRMNLLTEVSGGSSIELIERDFKEALEDPQAKSIILHIDSPGGSVDGVQEVANLIFDSRKKKPIVAFTDGMMGSAAYWMGSAAEKIYISSDTNQVGSIGVVATHVDVSKAEEQMGYKTTEIVAGRYKRIASQYAPLSEEGRATLQEAVDYIYSVFVNDVAKFRGVPIEKALGMADGKVFIGRQSLEAGLVDDILTLDVVVNNLSQTGLPRSVRAEIEENCIKTYWNEGGKENALSERT
jgi:signal peptide peptidase SppA